MKLRPIVTTLIPVTLFALAASPARADSCSSLSAEDFEIKHRGDSWPGSISTYTFKLKLPRNIQEISYWTDWSTDHRVQLDASRLVISLKTTAGLNRAAHSASCYSSPKDCLWMTNRMLTMIHRARSNTIREEYSGAEIAAQRAALDCAEERVLTLVKRIQTEVLQKKVVEVR